MARCVHKSKQSGQQCKNEAGDGREDCHIHGGKSLKGIAAPNYQGKGYSRYAVQRIADTINERTSRPNKLSLEDGIDLLDARLVDLLGRVDSGESGETWKALQSAVREFDKAERRANGSSSPKVQEEAGLDREEAMRTIIVLVQEGMSDWAAWREVGSVYEQIRKTTETEAKNRIAAREMITREQLAINEARYMQLLIDILNQFVPADRITEARRDVSAKCMTLFLEN